MLELTLFPLNRRYPRDIISQAIFPKRDLSPSRHRRSSSRFLPRLLRSHRAFTQIRNADFSWDSLEMHARNYARTCTRDWRRHVLSLRKVSTKLHDVTVKTAEGGAGGLNNAPIIHADKRVVCIPILPPFPTHLAAPHTHKYARQRTRAHGNIYRVA